MWTERIDISTHCLLPATESDPVFHPNTRVGDWRGNVVSVTQTTFFIFKLLLLLQLFVGFYCFQGT